MLSDAQREEVVSAVLQSGLDDWVPIAEISSIAEFYGVPATVLRSKITTVPDWAIEPVIREVVERGLMRVGDVYTHGRFVPFDGDDESAIQWMMGILHAAEGGWPLLAWLDLTDRGEELAKKLPRAPYLDRPWFGDEGETS